MGRLRINRKTFYDLESRRIDILDDRFYVEIDNPDIYYPSVTHILDCYPKGWALTQWHKSLGFNADIILERAAAKGSKIHDAIKQYLKGVRLVFGHYVELTDGGGTYFKTNYELDEWEQLLRFHEFWTAFKPTLIVAECVIVSTMYKMGGTVDIICEINGERWLIDTKTGNDVYPVHEFQVAAYAMMWNEKNPDVPIERCGIIHLDAATRGADKKSEKIQGKGWKIHEFDRHYGDAFKIFKALRTVWDEQNPDYKPKILSMPTEISLPVDENYQKILDIAKQQVQNNDINFS